MIDPWTTVQAEEVTQEGAVYTQKASYMISFEPMSSSQTPDF
jgi:hypothetical protein